MKKLIALLFLLSPSVALANIKQEFVTSAQISIDSPYVITNAAPNSYSISGNKGIALLLMELVVLIYQVLLMD